MEGLAPSTRRTYCSAQRKFIAFAKEVGANSPCPANEDTLCWFASSLAKSMQHKSIKVYLAAVRSLHIDQGYPDPLANCLKLAKILRGIKRLSSPSQHQRLPITDVLMHKIYSSLQLTCYNDTMLWAAATLAYFGFLRSSEFTVPSLAGFDPQVHLQLRDLAFDNLRSPTCLRVWIKASKTDPFRIGCPIYVGRGNGPFCAVRAMSVYLNKRGNTTGPLFLFESGQPLSRMALASWLQTILSKAGIEGSYNTHSFRIGAATVAARKGIPEYIIQRLGRWSSNAFTLYTRIPPNSLAGISQLLS